MKPARPISVPHAIALLIITVTCHTARASLLELESFRLDNKEQNLSVRPSELFTLELADGLRPGLIEMHRKLLYRTETMCNYMASAWLQQTAQKNLTKDDAQSLVLMHNAFKRPPGVYRLGCLSLIYNKTLLQASCIDFTTRMSP